MNTETKVDLFTANQTGDATHTGATDTSTDPVATLVGDGKKFKDVTALARGKLEADAFIERLTKENEALRKEAEKNITLESVLEAISKQTPPKQETTTTQVAPTSEVGDIDTRVQRILDERATKERVALNMTKVHDAMVKALGSPDAASKAIAEKARALGTSVAKLRDLAAESPNAFLKIMDMDATKEVSRGPSIPGEINTEALGTTGTVEPGTYAYYEALRKKDKKTYFSPKIQNQMHKDMERLGEDKFFGRK